MNVDRMACDGCEANVEEAIRGVAGVTGVDADHEAGTVVVEGDADADALITSVDDIGCEASA